MAYFFQTKDKDGKFHSKWRFQYVNWEGKKCTVTGHVSKNRTELMAKKLEVESYEIKMGMRPPPTLAYRKQGQKIEVTLKEYLAWGKAQGGRGGRPWAIRHHKQKKFQLEGWFKYLDLRQLKDCEGCLPKVERRVQEWLAAGVASKSVKNHIEALNGFFNWCRKREYLNIEPLRNLSPIHVVKTFRRRCLTPAELNAILLASPHHQRLLFLVAACTGLRAQELRRLQVKDLDVVSGGIFLDSEIAKNRKSAFLPLPPMLIAELEAFARSQEATKCYQKAFKRRADKDRMPDSPLLYVPRHTAKAIKTTAETAGVALENEDGCLDFHALRVTFVTYALDVGANAKEAQELARHSTPMLTLTVYARASNERLRTLSEQIATKVGLEESTIEAQWGGRTSVSPSTPEVKVVAGTGFEPATFGL